MSNKKSNYISLLYENGKFKPNLLNENKWIWNENMISPEMKKKLKKHIHNKSKCKENSSNNNLESKSQNTTSTVSSQKKSQQKKKRRKREKREYLKCPDLTEYKSQLNEEKNNRVKTRDSYSNFKQVPSSTGIKFFGTKPYKY